MMRVFFFGPEFYYTFTVLRNQAQSIIKAPKNKNKSNFFENKTTKLFKLTLVIQMGWFSNTNTAQRLHNLLTINSFIFDAQEKKELLEAHNDKAIDVINNLNRLKLQTERLTTPELTKQAQDLGEKLYESINNAQIYTNRLGHLQTGANQELMAAQIMASNFHVPRIRREVHASTKQMANSCAEGSRRIWFEKRRLREEHNAFMTEVNHAISEVTQALPH